MKHIFILFSLFFTNLYSQNYSELICGLPNDISKSLPIYIAKTVYYYPHFLQSMQALSNTCKTWHDVIMEYSTDPKKKDIYLILSKRVYITPSHGFECDIEVIEQQRKIITFCSYVEECIGHAIIKNQKDRVRILCSLPNIQPNYEMEFPIGKMPLLAGAIKYNNDNDTEIIESLLKIHADPNKIFTYKKTTHDWPENNDPILADLIGIKINTPYKLAVNSSPAIRNLFFRITSFNYRSFGTF